MDPNTLQSVADQLIDAYDNATTLDPISANEPDFDTAAAYDVLDRIAGRRTAAGWKPVGRKIGFTNVTLWDRYGVDRPMWAHMWDRTVITAENNTATVQLDHLIQPRIEPEVVFKLRAEPETTDDPAAVLRSLEWMAPGFEIVQCHYPGWRFTLADCTAAFGLHGRLVVGTPVRINDDNIDTIASTLPAFELVLNRNGDEVERGVGSNVLGGPAHALTHLVRALADQPGAPSLTAGEIITTGTITDAQPVAPGEHWTSDYGELMLDGLTLRFA